jgi:ketosteroid isomerase-like protein
MSEKNIAIGREFLRAFNARDLDGLIALYADDAVHVTPKARIQHPESGGRVPGRQALREWWAESFDRLPSLQYDPVTVTADDERVWLEYRRRVPNEPELAVAEILVIRDGKVVQSRVYHG